MDALLKQTMAPQHHFISPASAYLSERLLTVFLRSATHKYLTLQTTGRRSLPLPHPDRAYTLYVHVPFCETLCPYCSFNRFIYQESKAEKYFSSLRDEMRRVAELGYRFNTMYIGGGTPTIHIDELIQTIDLARDLFPLTEVSCETNPNHLVPEIIGKLEGRVQRLSVGVQSFDDTLLKQMNRFEKFGSGAEILERIRTAAPHFRSLNVDMIFNFPGQTPDVLLADINSVIQSGAQQTTFYPLMSSPSVESSLKHSVGRVDQRREWSYFQIINEELKEHFQPLSSWTFVRGKDGMIDEYIADGSEYVGIGSGAFSYLDGTLYVNTFSLAEYQTSIEEHGCGITALQEYDALPQIRYALMMAMFGQNKKVKNYLRSLPFIWLERLFLTLSGAFKNGELTLFGRYLSVVMMREFFSGVNNVREIARLALSSEELACAMPDQYAGLRDYGSLPLLNK